MAEEWNLIGKLVSALLGLGWLSTAFAWWKERSSQKQKVRDYLAAKRQELNAEPDLLAVVGFLEAEREARTTEKNPPQKPFDGAKLRQLPAFLEEIGPVLELNPIRPRDAYLQFAKEVFLCDKSVLLWEEEPERYSDTYWGGFKKFARETEKHTRHLYAWDKPDR